MSDQDPAPRKPVVLLVEDDTFLRDIFIRKASETFTVLSTSEAKDVLSIAREHIPDVVLLDLNLPDGNGFDILRQIREDETLKATLVLILTNSVLSEDAMRSSELKADDFLTKANFSVEEIIQRIESHMANKGLKV